MINVHTFTTAFSVLTLFIHGQEKCAPKAFVKKYCIKNLQKTSAKLLSKLLINNKQKLISPIRVTFAKVIFHSVEDRIAQ